MPIEELLKLYYNKPEEGDEQTNNGENPQQPEEQVLLDIRAFCFDQRRILKKLFCLAGEAKLAIVVTNLAPNFDLEDFF